VAKFHIVRVVKSSHIVGLSQVSTASEDSPPSEADSDDGVSPILDPDESNTFSKPAGKARVGEKNDREKRTRRTTTFCR
jgi:hypothetical protein